MPDNDPQWYKDAIIYQLHIKAFFDANNDGSGDFAGLTQKLDYITELGVTAIWLLPFYPSPLRDDGYDIAEYKAINERYGKMADFRRFLREAHRRGLNVITELVINHTSDQHPWFQRARRAKPGSPWRDYYVWSETDQKHLDTRIIFTDTETSNWEWDPVAQAYYWHRFFSHQPDLNFDNPRVLNAVINVMKFWLDMGVDGLRLDAIPYLCEREGTSNENLPETHDVLKTLRRWVDEHYECRLLLGEANQWPEDVLPYFGDAEQPECHMAFHFPLMPRMYMALAQEDRHPVIDIMDQTPAIPEGAQWAVFLRNHDELTLEMVTDSERDYLWNFYASDPRMRINIGIRRRLAPLVDNDRNKLELLNSMLMSMPGTPIVYYGDEIGMGDNIFLGDRDSVRTPMQWSPDRNGGFSSADPARLYLPAVMDPIYGYQACNVESQRRNPSSYLNWIRRLVAVRKGQAAFGRGTLRFLYPGNRKVLAYLREYGEEIILYVANLSGSAQPVELDLAEFRGRVPVELLGDSPFPPVGELPYFLTLSPHGFYWFKLTTGTPAPEWHTEPALVIPEFQTLVAPRHWQDLVDEPARSKLENMILPAFFGNQRWFSGKESGIDSIRLADAQKLPTTEVDCVLTLVDVTLRNGSVQRYFLPLSIYWEQRDQEVRAFLEAILSRVRSGNRPGFLLDAMGDDQAIRRLLSRFVAAAQGASAEQDSARFRVTSSFPEQVDTTRVQVTRNTPEQSNTSVRIGTDMILKAYRQLHAGIHPELEIGRFLTDVVRYPNVAPLLGTLELVDSEGQSTALAVLQGFVENQGDGWSYTMDYLSRHLEKVRFADPEDPVEGDTHPVFMELMTILGQRVAELHRAFMTPTDDPAFTPEPVVANDRSRWLRHIEQYMDAARRSLQRIRDLECGAMPVADSLLLRWDELERACATLAPEHITALRTRCHGDLHLGQVLIAGNDFFIVDFEGEPLRPVSERRDKHVPLRDIAGLMRSIDYAARLATKAYVDRYPDEAMGSALEVTQQWQRQAQSALLDGYREHSAGCLACPSETNEFEGLLALFMLEKACYEVVYEANNRPAWTYIPASGLLDWLDRYSEATGDG